ncbi:MAG: glycosyl hydrolase [Pseudomonadota bacterium]|nr:glycosyl hydrolase [Pseudomonadota bacterium]
MQGAGRRRIGWLVFAAIVLGVAGAASWYGVQRWRPSVDRYEDQGLDVSDNDGPIDWWTVRAAGADFAYLRATVGADTRAGRFADNWRDVHGTGMRRGALHVYSLCAPAADQANNFNTTVPRDADALPAAVVLDFHPDCAARPDQKLLLDDIRRFMTMVELHTGKPMMMKLSRDFDATYHISAGIPRPVWAMQNFFAPGYPATPWRIWQASDLRRVDGIAGQVDWDVVAP